MIKLSAYEMGFAAALIKLGWDPNKVKQLIAQNRAAVEAARQKTVSRISGDISSAAQARAAQGKPVDMQMMLAGSGVGSARKHPLTGQMIQSPIEQGVMSSLGMGGKRAVPPPVPGAARGATPPPVPASARRVA